jgi:hypothetical protein
MAQVVECYPSKFKALSSDSSTVKNKRKKRREEKKDPQTVRGSTQD